MNIVFLDGDHNNTSINNLSPVSKKTLGTEFGYLAKARSVVKLNKDGNVMTTYRSAREAARENGMSYQTVMDRCNGKVKRLYAPDGCIYKWKDQTRAKVKMC